MTHVPGTYTSGAAPQVKRDLSPQGQQAETLLQEAGALVAERWLVGECSVMCSREPSLHGYRWHVSVAHPTRDPTWDEIKTAAYGIATIALQPGRTFAQLFGNPAETTWVDVHKHCYHLYEIDDPLTP